MNHKSNSILFGESFIQKAYTCALKYLVFEFKNTDTVMSIEQFTQFNDILLSNMELASIIYDVENDKMFSCKNLDVSIQGVPINDNDEVILTENIFDKNMIHTHVELQETSLCDICEFIDEFFGLNGIYIYKKFWRDDVFEYLYKNALKDNSYSITKISKIMLYSSYMIVGLLKAVCKFRYNVRNALYGEIGDYGALTKDIRDITFMYTTFHEIADNPLCLSQSDKLSSLRLEPQFLRIPMNDAIHISIRNCIII